MRAPSDETSARGAVLITGAGRGIGRAVAVAVAAAGFPLIITSRRGESLATTRAACERLVDTRSLVVDVRIASQVRMLRTLLDSAGLLHAVVNNAGVGEWHPIESTSDEAWDQQIDTNLRGPFFVMRETLPYLRRQRGGLYVNVGSDCSRVGMPERSAYNASKFGLVGLTQSLRAEAGPDGVHACLVYVGKTDTYFRGHHPGDRPGALAAEDVAEAIAFIIEAYPRFVIEELSVMPRGAAAQRLEADGSRLVEEKSSS